MTCSESSWAETHPPLLSDLPPLTPRSNAQGKEATRCHSSTQTTPEPDLNPTLRWVPLAKSHRSNWRDGSEAVHPPIHPGVQHKLTAAMNKTSGMTVYPRWGDEWTYKWSAVGNCKGSKIIPATACFQSQWRFPASMSCPYTYSSLFHFYLLSCFSLAHTSLQSLHKRLEKKIKVTAV